MTKLNRRSDKSIPFWKKWFEKPEEEEMTFATKHRKGRELDKKKLGIYFVLGLTVGSTLLVIGVPLAKQLRATTPQQTVNQQKTLDDALKQTQEALTTQEPETTQTTTHMDLKQDDTQEVVNQKVQEGLEKATAKVVEEYNKKLEEATKRIQETNTENAKLKAEKDVLQKQIDELKKVPAATPEQPTTTTEVLLTLPSKDGE